MAVSTFIVIFAANKRIAASYKHMEALNKLPWAAKSPIFKKVSGIGDISALSQDERKKCDYAIKVCRDNLCVYEDAVESGLKEGFKKGMKKGMKKGIEKCAMEKALSIAKKMKNYNTDISFIIKITGLTTEEIKAL